ncbi:MAG: hypothetical protein K9L68_00990 [Spirochaetales bacterium]|nr:hypothetical protein [Spirochaetales bacterium]MCF7937151.1 hypothetical protein [Spirochaetales bacterium]
MSECILIMRVALLSLASLSILLLSVVLPFDFSAEETGASGWKGYTPLAVQKELSHQRVTDALAEIGLTGVISEQSQSVRISSFNGTKEIPFTELGSRLESFDPRFDPYLRNLGSLFHVQIEKQDFRLYYLPHDRSISSLWVDLRRSLGPMKDSWRLPDSAGFLRWGKLIFLAALVAVFIFLSGKARFSLVFASLPWFAAVFFLPAIPPGVYLGGYVLVALVVYSRQTRFEQFLHYRLPLLSDNSDRRFAAVFLVAALLPALSFFLRNAGPPLAAAYLIPIAGSIAGAVFPAALKLWRSRGWVHRRFVPVSIFSARRQKQAVRFPLVMGIVLFVVLLHGGVQRLAGSFSQPFPQPVAFRSMVSPQGLQEMERFRKLETEKGKNVFLPNLADYTAHRAYQEGFPYRIPFAVPEEGTVVHIPGYKTENGVTREMKIPVLAFTDSWFAGIMREVSEESIVHLLTAQDGLVRVELRAISVGSGRIFLDLLICLLMFSPMMLEYIQISGIRLMKVQYSYRRKRQEA